MLFRSAATTPPLLQHGDESFTYLFGSGRIYGAEQEGSGGVAYVQQRDGEDFTTLLGLGRASRPGVSLLSRPVGTRRLAVEEVLQGAVLLPPSGSNDLVCSCRYVRSATVFGGGGCSLPRGCGTATPCL